MASHCSNRLGLVCQYAVQPPGSPNISKLVLQVKFGCYWGVIELTDCNIFHAIFSKVLSMLYSVMLVLGWDLLVMQHSHAVHHESVATSSFQPGKWTYTTP